MTIAAPAPSYRAPSFPAPVPAQIAAPFARAAPNATQDWQDALRAAPALQAPAIHAPAPSTPATEQATAPKHAPKPPAPPAVLARLWNAIRGITQPVKTPAPAPKHTSEPAQSPVKFSTTRASTAGFANDDGQAGRFMTPAHPGAQ